MTLKFLWADGQLGFASGFGKVHHRDILKKMIEEGRLTGMPQNYVGGDFTTDDFHGPAFDQVSTIWEGGNQIPSKDELRYVIQQELNRTAREAMYRQAADVEDTEPQGAGVGFLRDPHKELYPNLFRGDDKIPEDVKQKLKDYVLVPLSDKLTDPDKFIYFTIYGSGISYNWDEAGDLDLQLWIDIEKYSATVNDPLPIDDLLAEIRRIVQTVNFPSFAELGLDAPEDSLEDTTGAMLIQYYPKPGKGSKDENLASQPYACYDLETDEWLVKPKPINPKFYGDNFLMLMPKAKDIALQTEALLGEYQRNILNWQFWFSMYNKYKKPAYRKEYRQAMEDATQERAGIKNLFEGVFGGRAEAYAPGGKGIEDERDMVQKLLEVWGVFQELKHYARMPLPWEEQEMPVASHRVYTYEINNLLDSGGGTFYGVFNTDLTPSTRDHGYWVATQGNEFVLPVERFDMTAIHNYLNHVNIGEGEYLGVWVNNGEVYLDTTKWIPDPDTAIQVGIANGQQEIWDISNSQGIKLTKVAAPPSQNPSPEHQNPGGWSGIMEKAQRLRDNGQVQVGLNVKNHVTGVVQGDNGTYNTEIWRDDPNSGTITLWNCDCPWSEYSWGRTRQWKKYEGRPCAHTLALYWQALQTPLQDADQQTLPGTTPELDLPNALQQTVQQPQTQSPPMSVPQPAQQAEQLTIGFPGAFSRWRKEGLFENGDYVRTSVRVDGYDDRGTYYVVPKNMIGEVIWSDAEDTIAIFSIESGRLGPHNVKVTAPTDSFSLVPRQRGTAPRRR